jgi:metal-sulfur cluster biosynthetic enzyme
MITQKQVEKILDTVPDPELGISLVQLGLIYSVKVDKKNNIQIVMTLTSVGCPLFDQIEAPIREELGKLDSVGKIEIDLTFEPPWTPDKMSTEAKMQLGFA